MVLLILNTAVAALFALSYFLIAGISRGPRRVAAFGVSYLIGMLTPLSEILVRIVSEPAPFMMVSYMALLSGFVAMAAALSRFHRKRTEWGVIAAIAALGLVIRLLIWGGHRDDLIYELTYQLPLAVAIGYCAYTALRVRRDRLHRLLAGLFAITSLNFLIKPFVAATLGSGATARDYASSAYATYSQSSTSVLLIAAGLMVMLIVIQTIVQDYLRTSETDHLSGLLNRRGFDRQAEALLVAPTIGKRQLSAVMIDIDHFKRINDCFGHEIGDEVIRTFARTLQHAAPRTAYLARTGGEEFVILLNRITASGASMIVEGIRQLIRASDAHDLPKFTFSAGIAEYRAGDSVSALMRRADEACYRAKELGRDRIECAPTLEAENGSSNVIQFNFSVT